MNTWQPNRCQQRQSLRLIRRLLRDQSLNPPTMIAVVMSLLVRSVVVIGVTCLVRTTGVLRVIGNRVSRSQHRRAEPALKLVARTKTRLHLPYA